MVGSLHGLMSDHSENVVFLHGDLEIWILEAHNLPNMDLASERLRRCLTVFDDCKSLFSRSSKRKNGHKTITSDPYVSVCMAGATIAQTRVISNSEDPNWDEHFCVPVAHPVSIIEFQVKDNDVLGAELIGVVAIPVEKIITGKRISGWFPLVGPNGNLTKTCPELQLSLHFSPVDDNGAIASGPDYWGVNAYFPLHKGGKVTLYQDAHIPDGSLPEIPLDGGKVFQHAKCWEDICHAILEARHLIYIVGWSVFHQVKLVREPIKPLPGGGELQLGELLKFKAEEGVRVAMLIWDDKTSHDKFLIKTEGVMQTHDEETRKFFKHSAVHCVLAPRYASHKLSIFKQKVVGTFFTHHQKCVIVDSQASGDKRKITAFIGGLDLCDGRYDTPEHRLFHNLDNVFANDFHNPTFPVGTKSPRQPWHDLHCRIEGPAAYDILTNFEQRWRKSAKWKQRIHKVTHWHDDVLVKLDRMSWMVHPSTVPGDDSSLRVTDEEDSENWHVQVFRSIDSGSVKGFPKVVQEAEVQNLVCAKNLKTEKSIHTAYIKAIRSARHFIYIENQYFLGSSYYWPSYKNAGADNLVPMEIALKIASKIALNERFSVYVVIPMWPEGIPTAASVQEILFWQGQTMQMMYGVIASALAAVGGSKDRHPQDYLNFYCLGKREYPGENSHLKSQQADSASLGLAQKFRRFMIYVHSKGMIVDDEYILLGSANINQRSLDGSRDTEIAVGAYQPHHSWADRKGHPRGQVYGYRMSLWAEHLGLLENCFLSPQNLECVKRVNELAEKNWQTYVEEEVREMKGHLLKYPIKVSKDGIVGPLPGYEYFPDVGGKILGAHSSLPDALTT